MSEAQEHIEKQAAEIAAEPETSSFKLIFSLSLAGLVSGLIIVGSYIFTLPIIEQNKADAQRRAIFMVLPGCVNFSPLQLVDGKLIEKDIQSNGSKNGKKEVQEIFAGFDAKGSFIGYAIPASGPGFQDIIGTIFGYDVTNRTIIGFQVLESKETPGLGDKIVSDAGFAMNFTALAVMPEILPTKVGTRTSPNQLETISGATISSKAVIKLLNGAVKLWYEPINAFDSGKLEAPEQASGEDQNNNQSAEDE